MIRKTGLIQLILAILLNPIFYCLLAILLITNEIVRLFVSVVLRIKFGKKISLVSDGADGYYGYKKAGCSRNAVVYFVFPVGYLNKQKVANFYQKEIQFYRDSNGNRIYEKLEKILVTTCGYFCWKSDNNFSVYNHIRVLNEKHVYSVKSVEKLFSSLADDMEDSKPQWELIIIPKFNDGTGEIKSILTIRQLHAYVDGLSFIMLCKNHVFPNMQYQIDPLKFKIPFLQKAALYFSTLIFAPLGVMIYFVEKFYLKTLIKIQRNEKNYSVTRKKYFTMAQSLLIKNESIKSIRFAIGKGTTVTNVICAAYMSALGKVLPENRIIKEVIVGEVLANLPYPNSNPQNRFSVLSYGIKTGKNQSSDPIKTLKICKEERQRNIFSPEIYASFYFVKIVGRSPSFVSTLLSGGLHYSLAIDNAPASKTTMNLKDGTPVLSVGGYAPHVTDCGISVAVTQHGDEVTLGFCADSSWLSETELHTLVNQISREINIMCKLCAKTE